ncbi:Protein of unknown function [Chitinophaga jiangningensis]|uniref:DUF3137 domain-containing protein n=1 Tax=Chitinophaga jiangningensis TaxID=1419482 RepID=A0A1M7CUK9_9BACT|nr:DUF3137 domain-containing protein [Chitinophaga jiangningensis]SHL70932.1 Protein of unknown function [Chitinophaga jiangningensis]
MKSANSFNEFAEVYLQQDLRRMEKMRINLRKTWWWWLLLIGFILLFYFFVVQPVQLDQEEGQEWYTKMAYIGIGLLLALGGGMLIRNLLIRQFIDRPRVELEADYKEKVVRTLLHFWEPGLRYDPDHCFSYEDLVRSGFFSAEGTYYRGNDLISGRRNNLSFRICDLVVTSIPDGRNIRRQQELLFCGSCGVLESPRFFDVPVYVFTKGVIPRGELRLGHHIQLPDVAFNQQFTVFSPDIAEATYLLKPNLLKHIAALKYAATVQVFLTFYQQYIYIGIHSGIDYFELNFNCSLTDTGRMYNELVAFGHQLDLMGNVQKNVSIWTVAAFSRS